jgi:tetratricopeptide (TPR) repeat protein
MIFFVFFTVILSSEPVTGQNMEKVLRKLKEQKLAEAETLAYKLYKKNRENHNYVLLYADILIKNKEYDEAHAILKKFGKNNALSARGLFLLGKTSFFLKKNEEAEKNLQKALNTEDKPLKAQTYFYLGELFWLKKEYEAAEKYYKQSLLEKPDFYTVIYPLAYLYYTTGKYKKALSIIEKGLQTNNRSPYLLNLKGMIYYKTYQDKKAEQAYKSALKADKNFGIALINLGILYYTIQKYDRAYNYFTKAKKLFSKAKKSFYYQEIIKYLEAISLVKQGPVSPKRH